MLQPNFCTTVSPDEYDCLDQFEEAVKDANKFHKKHHPECPPPYYTFDYGKLYGLVKYYAETKGAVRRVNKLEAALENLLNMLAEHPAVYDGAAEIKAARKVLDTQQERG